MMPRRLCEQIVGVDTICVRAEFERARIAERARLGLGR